MADINMADWAAAEKRRQQALGYSSPPTLPDAPTSTAEAGDAGASAAAGAPNGPGTAPPYGSPWTAAPGRAQPRRPERAAWERARRWTWFTRCWAFAKVALSALSTWLTMGAAHTGLGTTVCAYGVVCFWWALGPHWRKRCFGPGQQLEPDLYEELSRWLMRAGTALVLVGGALYLVRLR
jgi:hypothetical protein